MIEKTIDLIVKELPPSSGHDLDGMESDMRNTFNDGPATRYVSHDVTSDIRCLIEINLEVTETTGHLIDVTENLLRNWQSVYYYTYQATSFKHYKEHVVMRFVTIGFENKYYVTGKAVAGGVHYQRLVEGFYGDDFVDLPNAYKNSLTR